MELNITTVQDETLDCNRLPSFDPLKDECPRFLPTQFIRSTGID